VLQKNIHPISCCSLHHGLGAPVARLLITHVAGIAMHTPVGVEVPEATLIAILQLCPGHVPATCWIITGHGTYWCVLRREWMGCWGLLERLLIVIVDHSRKFPA